MSSKQILIYGAGGHAREVAWLIQDCSRVSAAYEVAGFIDDNPATHGKILNGIPVMGLQAARERFPQARVVGGVGSPATRQRLMEKAAASGFAFETVIHPQVERSQWIEIGEGTVICCGSVLTTNIFLGRHVQINVACTVSHDAIMGDFATLAPGVHVAGCVHLGRRVWVGTGAVLINGTQDAPIVVGDDAVIGAGACVTKNVAAGVTVVGVPAKPLVRS